MDAKKYFGRKKQLALLNKRFYSEKFEFGYLYGQRRIGKTSLLKMLSKDKKVINFYAADSSDIDIKASFSNTLNESMNLISGVYPTWFDFFKILDECIGDQKILVTIDEYPNIVVGRDGKRKQTDFDSSLQKAIDLLFKYRKFTLI